MENLVNILLRQNSVVELGLFTYGRNFLFVCSFAVYVSGYDLSVFLHDLCTKKLK